ncbi:MAG: hypothetical protein JRH15_10130 [Deltaproteobacteria bacterium]|nr:hypothetical protein [Deltaproteobacteria bacterium]
MSHNYLLQLYQNIEARRQAVSDAGCASESPDQSDHRSGQLSALEDIQNFLSDRFNRKLPKRLLRNLEKTKQMYKM